MFSFINVVINVSCFILCFNQFYVDCMVAAPPLILGGPKNFRPKNLGRGRGGGGLTKKLNLGGGGQGS